MPFILATARGKMLSADEDGAAVAIAPSYHGRTSISSLDMLENCSAAPRAAALIGPHRTSQTIPRESLDMRRRRNQHPPTPRAIDPASGFKVPLSGLVRQWDGEMVSRRFVDKRNPQDFLRARPDRMNLPFARPEPPDRFMAQNILLEDGRPLTLENGAAMLTEGEVVVL